jgi:hypothetical protein
MDAKVTNPLQDLTTEELRKLINNNESNDWWNCLSGEVRISKTRFLGV